VHEGARRTCCSEVFGPRRAGVGPTDWARSATRKVRVPVPRGLVRFVTLSASASCPGSIGSPGRQLPIPTPGLKAEAAWSAAASNCRCSPCATRPTERAQHAQLQVRGPIPFRRPSASPRSPALAERATRPASRLLEGSMTRLIAIAWHRLPRLSAAVCAIRRQATAGIDSLTQR